MIKRETNKNKRDVNATEKGRENNAESKDLHRKVRRITKKIEK